jgi:hypothetical protein
VKKENVEPETGERGRSEERRASGTAAANADVPPVSELPPPAMGS